MTILLEKNYEIWEKIKEFELDEQGVSTPFSHKLSKENSWTKEFTQRAIKEYKKFIFLTVINEQGACPSNVVDQVWHLHLTFTRSYWEDFCGKTLQKKVHHHPSKGGPEEIEKHISSYSQTFSLYIEVFEEEPPLDIWPHPTNSNLSKEKLIVVPFSFIPQLSLYAPLFLLPFIFIFFFFEQLNPYRLSGIHFIQFYSLLALIAIVVVYLLNRDFSGKVAETANNAFPKSYSLFEVVSVIFGRDRAIQTAIIDLVRKGALIIEKKKFINKSSGIDFASNKNPLVSLLLSMPEKLRYQQIVKRFKKEEITSSQLLYLKSFANKRSAYPMLLFSLVLVVGVARTIQGLNNDKPVDYLVFSMIVFTMFYWGIYTTNNKKIIVKNTLRTRFQQDNLSSMNVEPQDEVLKTFALTGLTAIKHFDEYPILAAMFATSITIGSTNADFSSGNSSSCSSSCGSSCSSGCGGCSGD